ncbi:MAG: SAF domain-containing protein [Chloroflexi bacterium]|nr:SAF domain-containing protein [Chloroflexota bacterium]
MLRSATFTIGLVLAGLAFVGFLMLGGMTAPPPYSIVVAVQDIPAYTLLDAGALGVDAQRINSQVAHTLVQREEIDQFVGGFVLENIHAGEPLRKGAIVAPDNPQAASRLALMMTDPGRVAMVVPLDAKTAPGQIAPGDWVDLVLGLTPGNISASSGTTFGSLLTPTPVALSFPLGPSLPITSSAKATPQPQPVPNFSFGTAVTTTGSVSASEMNLPVDKVVIQNIPVVGVRFQQVPNPAFTGSGGSLGQSGSTTSSPQPAYIQGDIQSVTVLLPRASVELVTFAMDNGRVHVALLPAQSGQAANGAQSPTFGISFNDVLAWMMRERALSASGQPPVAPAQATPTQSAPSAPQTPVGGAPTQVAPGIPPATTQPNATEMRLTPAPKSTPAPATIATGLDFMALLIPLSCGIVLLVLFVAVVRFVRKRRRDDDVV